MTTGFPQNVPSSTLTRARLHFGRCHLTECPPAGGWGSTVTDSERGSTLTCSARGRLTSGKKRFPVTLFTDVPLHQPEGTSVQRAKPCDHERFCVPDKASSCYHHWELCVTPDPKTPSHFEGPARPPGGGAGVRAGRRDCWADLQG